MEVSGPASEKSNGAPPWLEALAGDLRGAEAVLAALQDVASACGDMVDATWIDLRQQSDIRVYVLASGVLHRVVGQRDAEWDRSKPDDVAVTTAEYGATRIRRSSSYRVEVQRMQGQSSASVSRSWTFTELGEFGSLNVQWPLREDGPLRKDPTAFADSVVKAILAASQD